MSAALTVFQTIGLVVLILGVLAIPVVGLMLLAGAVLRENDREH